MMIERRVSVEHADVFAENGHLKVERAELPTKLADQASTTPTCRRYGRRISGRSARSLPPSQPPVIPRLPCRL